jgi:hypothetical protein
MKVFVNYIRINNHWTYQVERGKVKATGDNYPGTKKGEHEMKRDCAEILRHMREKDDIIVKRYE